MSLSVTLQIILLPSGIRLICCPPYFQLKFYQMNNIYFKSYNLIQQMRLLLACLTFGVLVLMSRMLKIIGRFAYAWIIVYLTAVEKPPTILFRHQLGPIAQSNDGRLIVYPGTILHMECLWIRRFGTPKWVISHNYR